MATQAIIRKGTTVETVEELRGTVVEVKRVERAIRPDGDRLYVVKVDDGRELRYWGWELSRAPATH